MSGENDLLRMKKEYALRKSLGKNKSIYSRFSPANLYMLQHREKDLLSLLGQKVGNNLSSKKILEVGCGNGGVLLEYLLYGAKPQQLFGLDYLFDRLPDAKEKIPSSRILQANGERIPFERNSFDLVLQYTAFSSILDPTIKRNIANDMLRVLKPDGWIIWYDFWINPINKQTKGIGVKEIHDLFPECQFQFRKVTLAPPIARKVVPVSWLVAHLLECIKIFNTHYLVLIQPN